MKRIFFLCILLDVSSLLTGQVVEKPAILYGLISKKEMQKSPFDKWFNEGYENYGPDTTVLRSLKRIAAKDVSIQIFLGTWCGDSRREVPRFMKTLDACLFPPGKVQVIAVGGTDSLYKQSPQHEEAGKGIFRVPVFIISEKGREIGRINEYPVNSLEKDLLAILDKQPYSPNYKSFAAVRAWLADGILKDANVSSRGLAGQLRSLIAGENELNSLGYVLLKQEKKAEALAVFRINANLFPESSNVISSLGEGYLENDDRKSAVQYLERSLELNKDPQQVKPLLKLLYKAKGLKE